MYTDPMSDNFIFLCVLAIGIFLGRMIQLVVTAHKNYKIFKMAEVYSISLVLETEAWRHHALQILEVVYEHSDKPEEYQKVQESVNKKYDEVQQSLIRLISERLPYEINYKTLGESEKHLREHLTILRREKHGDE